jgi:hypothetical protein
VLVPEAEVEQRPDVEAVVGAAGEVRVPERADVLVVEEPAPPQRRREERALDEGRHARDEPLVDGEGEADLGAVEHLPRDDALERLLEDPLVLPFAHVHRASVVHVYFEVLFVVVM